MEVVELMFVLLALAPNYVVRKVDRMYGLPPRV